MRYYGPMNLFRRYHSFGHDTTVVCLHGFLGSHLDWDPYIPILGSQFNILTLDLPGHGRSPMHAQTTLVSTALAIQNIVTSTLPNQRIILLGYSMGGRIASILSAQFSGLFHHSFLISTGQAT